MNKIDNKEQRAPKAPIAQVTISVAGDLTSLCGKMTCHQIPNGPSRIPQELILCTVQKIS